MTPTLRHVRHIRSIVGLSVVPGPSCNAALGSSFATWWRLSQAVFMS